MEGILACVFCERIERGEVLESNDLAVAFLDGFPLSRGHCLIVPRRHEASFLELEAAEQAAVWALVAPVEQLIEANGPPPDGYNIGINIGVAAGQTVAHAHLHVIPRYLGDVVDPKGGVRCVIPGKARYWEER